MNKKKIIMPVCMAAMTMSMMTGGMIHADEQKVTSTLSEDDSTQTIDVDANIIKSCSIGSADTVYSVDIAWTVPTLSVAQAGDANTYEWDPVSASYKKTKVTTNSKTLSSQEGTVKITVTNRSNGDITYSIGNEIADGYKFESSKSPATKSATKIAAADEKADAYDGAYAKMLKGSEDATNLTGTVLSDTFTNTIKLASTPLFSPGEDNALKTSNAKSVVKYTVSLAKASSY